jgi:UDP-3-O-[3-hydroxymyristoyl] glucosamine N-acyltransferase
MTLKLQQIVDALSGEFNVRLVGDGEAHIDRLAALDEAGDCALSFLSHPKYSHKLTASKAACVVVAPAAEQAAAKRGAYIVVDDPYLYFAHITQLWKRHHAVQVSGPMVHPTAFIDPTATVDASARIGAFAVVGARAVVAGGAHISEHCVLGEGASVGANTHFAPRVTLLAGCAAGQRCIVHSGVVIGADGFGFAPDNGQWVKIEQLGAVRIGNDVEIGANTCIDRGALGDTVIEDGVKLDNLIQIGHNARIGAHTAMAGCAGVAGSAVIGAHCTIGGGAVVLGHLKLADHVHISAASVVTRSIAKAGNYTGFFPIDDNAGWEKNAATVKQLHSLRDRLKHLEKLLEKPLEKPSEKPLTSKATS